MQYSYNPNVSRDARKLEPSSTTAGLPRTPVSLLWFVEKTQEKKNCRSTKKTLPTFSPACSNSSVSRGAKKWSPTLYRFVEKEKAGAAQKKKRNSPRKSTPCLQEQQLWPRFSAYQSPTASGPAGPTFFFVVAGSNDHSDYCTHSLYHCIVAFFSGGTTKTLYRSLDINQAFQRFARTSTTSSHTQYPAPHIQKYFCEGEVDDRAFVIRSTIASTALNALLSSPLLSF